MLKITGSSPMPVKIGERLTLPTVPDPWCDFTYEIIGITDDGDNTSIKLKIVEESS